MHYNFDRTAVLQRLAGGLNWRAVWVGAVVDVAGSLVMSTIVGVAAICGMLTRGDTPEMIANELPASLALVLCVATGGMLMSLAGGYVSASKAGIAHLHHAVWTGVLSVVLNLLLLATLGESGPPWLVASTTLLIVPCAALGGWLAMPVPAVPAAAKGFSR